LRDVEVANTPELSRRQRASARQEEAAFVRGLIGLVSLCLAVGAACPASAQAPLERGRYLVEVLAACGNCHTPKGPEGDLPGKHLAGGFQFEEPFGIWISPNITPDTETGIGRWTDAEIIRAIREGKRPDGRTLGPPMPFYLYRQLSDSDVTAVVAYLRTVPPVRQVVARSQYKMALPDSYGPSVGAVPDPPRQDLVKYGEYLAGPVAHCLDCHTPHLPDGRPELSRLGAGGFDFPGPWGVSYSANLTSDVETGLGAWKDGEIIAALYGARRSGGRVLPPMPTQHYSQGIAEGDLRAIIAYLRSLPPVRYKVPAPEPPKKP
jgi:mono/diheme cytochrome c family protein